MTHYHNLFNKLFWCTDQHLGVKGNSQIANKDVLDFFDWAIDEAKTWGAETCILGGDLFDSRHSIGVLTINTALSVLDKLAEAEFEKLFILLGNHDLPWRDKRDSASVEIARNYKNFHIVRDPTVIGNVSLIPWLVNDEPKTFQPEGRYGFGHLELPGFLMNSKVVKPETEHSLQADIFKEQEIIFSGHFHKRQWGKGNICYTGACMPLNFSDDGDEDRGIMLLKWGDEPIFKAWPQQPLYKSMKLTDVLSEPDKLLKPNMTARITIDIPLRYEEAEEIRNNLISTYGLRKIELNNGLINGEEEMNETDMKIMTLDQIIMESLRGIESVELSKDRLIDIYQSLIV